MNRFIAIAIFALSFLTLSYSHLPDFFKLSDLNKINKAERILSENSVRFGLKDMAPGHYYFSLGRTSVSCNINTSNGYSFRATSLDNKKRVHLIAGFDFLVKNQERDFSININCPNRAPKTYKIQPFVSDYNIGMAVNLFELLFYVVTTPFSSLVVLLSSIYLYRREKLTGLNPFSSYNSLFFFSLCTFFYAISFSQIPKLFFDSTFTATNHLFIRILLHASFLNLVSDGHKSPILKRLVILYVGIGIMLFGVAKFHEVSTASLWYSWILFTFPLTSFVAIILQKKSYSEINRMEFFKIIMLGTYMLNCLHDAFSWILQSPTYSTPGTILLITTATAILLQTQSEAEVKVSQIKQRLEDRFKESSTLFHYLEKSAELFKNEFGFADAKIFVHERILKNVPQDKIQSCESASKFPIQSRIGNLERGKDGSVSSIIPYNQTLYIALSSLSPQRTPVLSLKRLLLNYFDRIQNSFEIHLESLIAQLEDNSRENILMRQITHDAQSPISVLEYLGEQIDTKGKHDLFTNAIQRLQSILKHSIPQNTSKLHEKTIEAPQLIVCLKKIIKEKQVLHRCNFIFTACERSLTENTRVIYSKEFERVFSNILNNAIEASKKDGDIRITTELLANSLKLTFRDFGEGIEPKYLGKIFERGVTLKEGGSGLGLFHAKSTLEKVGGKIHLESDLGKGSTVTLVLPVYTQS